MSPRTTTLLALIGVLLAGIPLPALTAARREQPAVAPETPRHEATRPTYATLQASGQPQELRLLHRGKELARLRGAELAALPCELELMLPATGSVELEVITRWAEGATPQAVSLTLEPDGLPSRTDTQWTLPASSELHSLFIFSW